MRTADVRSEMIEIVTNGRWEDLLPFLFSRLSCPVNLQQQATGLFQANLALLEGLRRSSKTIVIGPILPSARGVIDYTVDSTIVELKTSESVLTTQVCQVALYTFAATEGGIYDPATRQSSKLSDASPALHFARFGTIAKVPMPQVEATAVYPRLLISPVSKLVKDRDWLDRVFDMGEVQEMCASLEAYLTSKGMRVPTIRMTPTEMSILGTFVDAFVKMVLARNFEAVYAQVFDELVRVRLQLNGVGGN